MKHNNWYVITGAPCSGKTTVLKELEKKGYKIIPEAARMYIDREMANGKILQDIRKDEIQFQKNILRMKIEIEESLPKDEIIFFDRGIPDSIAYYQLQGFAPDKELQKALHNAWYKKVFLFERLPYTKDYARVEDETIAQRLQELLRESYEQINVPIITIPLMPISNRVNHVLKHL